MKSVEYLYDENDKPLQGIVDTKFSKSWYKDGILHRDKGPAKIEYNKNGKVSKLHWYKNGLSERFKRPAYIQFDDASNQVRKIWFKAGKKIKLEDQGYIEHYNLLGHIHRIDGPAIIKPNGDKEWYQYGKLHREDGPAIELHDGYKGWFTHGVCTGDCGGNFTKCTYDEKIDFDIIAQEFNTDIKHLIAKYESHDDYYIVALFLKNSLETFNKFVYGRDKLLDRSKVVLLVDHPNIYFPGCKEMEGTDNGSN